jgi:hypothetical protein
VRDLELTVSTSILKKEKEIPWLIYFLFEYLFCLFKVSMPPTVSNKVTFEIQILHAMM